jgi:trimethylamine--corrinoid protein Co-methyltransferase
MSSRSEGTRTRRGSERRRAGTINQLPRRQIVNSYPRLAIVSDDEIEMLHQASLRLLSDVGVKCYSPEARAIFARAGALVDDASMRVRLGRELVEHALTTVPPVIELVPRNPANSVRVGGRNIAFATVLGPPNCSDIERGRRSGTLADHDDFLRLAQYFNIIQLVGGSPVEPLDIEVRYRHLEATRSMLTLTDKVPYVFCLSRQRILDVFEMCAIARGETLEQFAAAPGVFSIINTNSPLQYDLSMATGVHRNGPVRPADADHPLHHGRRHRAGDRRRRHGDEQCRDPVRARPGPAGPAGCPRCSTAMPPRTST